MKRRLPAPAALGAIAALAAAALAAVPAVRAQSDLPAELGEAIPEAGQTPPEMIPAAILQGLNKTTARVSTIEAPIGAAAQFGTLEITARDCIKKPPTEPPESAAYLEIVDVRPDSPAVPIFSGWMFASSPAISALEHPVYDVWVIDCGEVAGFTAMPSRDPAVGWPETPESSESLEPVDRQSAPLQ